MSDQSKGPAKTDLAEALAALKAKTGAPTEPDDLGQLAQIHERIEAVQLALKAAGFATAADLGRKTRKLIEAVILGETSDPSAAVFVIDTVVAALEAAQNGDETVAETLLPQVNALRAGCVEVDEELPAPAPQPQPSAPPSTPTDEATPPVGTAGDLPGTLAFEPIEPQPIQGTPDADADLLARAEQIAAQNQVQPATPVPFVQASSSDQTKPSATNDAEPPEQESPAPAEPAAASGAPAALTALADAVAAGVRANDLSTLAQIHSRCEELVAASQPDGESPQAEAGQVANALANLVSGMILDEVADAETAVAQLPGATACLQGLFAGEPVDVAGVLAAIETSFASTTADASAAPAADASEPAAAGTPATATPAPEPTPVVEQVAEAPVAAVPSVVVEEYVSEPLRVDLDDKESLQGFVDEAREHIDAIEGALLEVEQAPQDTDRINELFRPFHTIKGIAGFLNLRDINYLTHEAETILDMGRKGTMKITAGIIDVIFSAIDVLKAQIDALGGYLVEPSGDVVWQPPCTAMVTRLRMVAAGEAPEVAAAATGGTAAADVDAASSNQAEAVDPVTAPQDGTDVSATGTEPSREMKSNAVDLSIRVDTGKLDALVDTVGELVIAQTMVNLNSSVDGDEGLRRAVTQVTKIVRDVQETAMGMRMVPVGQTFQKMKRVVRDVGRKAGKNVELIISGDETELDKNVIQQISDPLVHMVRNAVDHGLETPEGRKAAGKSEVGLVYLDAFHEGDSVIIEIRDDGRGLDPQKLINKGVERGVISPEEQLSDQQAFALIMAAGFSTAEQVTDISGRGVGMDVVRRNIEELRGKIEIDSEFGKGSTFRIKLPLTLAIIDGMLIRVGDERVVIPTILIEKSLRPEPDMITTVQRRGEMLRVRGELFPLIQLGQHFGYCGRIEPTDALVVIASSGAQRIGIVVSELIGQQQIVIKSLGEEFKGVGGVSGAAILGDGRVGLILEPAGLLALHRKQSVGGTLDEPKPVLTRIEPEESGSEEAPAESEAETESGFTEETKVFEPAVDAALAEQE